MGRENIFRYIASNNNNISVKFFVLVANAIATGTNYRFTTNAMKRGRQIEYR
jgi:hypothetical protein